MIEITDNEGFSKNDLFKRKDYGHLLSLIIRPSEPVVIGLDAKWGMGKTTFAKMWAGELRKENQPVIYFDAFACDYIDNPFIAVVGEIVKKTKNLGTVEQPFYDSAIHLAKSIIKSTSINLPFISIDAGKVIEAQNEGMEADIFYDIIMKRDEQEESIKQFKDYLSSLPSKFPENKEGKPLVIIIDELDRCKPTFALGILETVKHFFSVPHVHFVLVANFEQMESSVKCQYGSDIDAARYLQKFYTFLFTLPAPKYGTGGYAVSICPEDHIIQESIKFLANIVTDQVDLRTLEKIVTHITNSSYYGAFSGMSGDAPYHYTFLVLFKYQSPALFKCIKNGGLIEDKDLTSLSLDDHTKKIVKSIPSKLRDDKNFKSLMNAVDTLVIV